MEPKLINYQYTFTEVGGKLHLVVKLLEDTTDHVDLMAVLSEKHEHAAVIILKKDSKVSNAVSPDQEQQRIISQYIQVVQDRLDWRKDALLIE